MIFPSSIGRHGYVKNKKTDLEKRQLNKMLRDDNICQKKENPVHNQY